MSPEQTGYRLEMLEFQKSDLQSQEELLEAAMKHEEGSERREEIIKVAMEFGESAAEYGRLAKLPVPESKKAYYRIVNKIHENKTQRQG